MGQQQIILITLCVIVIGAAIAVGLVMFLSNNIAANRDAMIEDLNTIAGNAKAFYIKPRFMGGGGNSFTGYDIPRKLKRSENGTYSASSTNTTVYFTGASKDIPDNQIMVVLDVSRPQLYRWTFLNDFDDSD